MNEELELLLVETTERMEQALKALIHEFASIRTGRANPAILDKITVNYYGVPTPINQISSISVVEGTQLYIKPFDKNILKDIEQAINASDLGLPPSNDGVGIRLVLPSLTQERRKETAKVVEKTSETGKVAIRNIRRDANDQVKKLELREDDEKKALDDVQKLTDDFIKKVEKETQLKVEEVMKI